MKEYRRLNPEKTRSAVLKARYGISAEEYADLLEKQHGRCAICSTEACNTGRRFAVDHDHHTKRVRALLCSNCNKGLGHFQDSQELLRNAAVYLDDHTHWQD